MGAIHHHTIVVTSSFEDLIKRAHKIAKGRFPYVSPLSPRVINGYRSFFIPPDGSKEHWEPSDRGDTCRQGYIEWLDAQSYEDGSSGLKWVEVGFGDYGYAVDDGDRRNYIETIKASPEEYGCDPDTDWRDEA